MCLTFPLSDRTKCFTGLIVLLLSVFQHCTAQPAPSKKCSDDSAVIKSLIALSEGMQNPDSMIATYNAAVKKNLCPEYNPILVMALTGICNNYLRLSNYSQSMVYIQKALPYCSNHQDSARYYRHQGSVYFLMGNYVAASENYYKVLRHIKKNDATSTDEVTIYLNLGMIYFRIHQNEKAEYYFNLAEKIARKNKFRQRIAIILVDKGEFYTSLHRPDSARKYAGEIISIGKEIDRSDLIAYANEEMGIAYVESGDYAKAIGYLQAAIDLSKGKYENIVIDASYYLGEAWYHLGRYGDGERSILSALKAAAAGNMKDNIILGYTTLAAIYRTTGRYKEALNYMDSISELKEALESSEKTNTINLLDVKFKTVEKDKQIAEGQLLIARQKSKIARKNMWMLAVGGSISLLLFASMALYRSSLHKIKSLKQENKIDILKAAVAGGENERTRIARELHDGIGGMLSAVKMCFTSVQHNNEALTQIPAYREAITILGEMGDEIRKTAHNLMPEVLLKQNLTDAMRSYCNTAQEDSTLQVNFQSYGVFDDLPENFKLNAYRIVQELLNNIIQHANAHHVLVELLLKENSLVMTIEDDGVGFDVNEAKRGIGLHNVQTRVKSMDGRFSLESEIGKGTSVLIEFDLKNIS